MFTRSELANIAEKISNVTDQRTLLNNSLQIALNRVYQFHDWPYYLDFKNGAIETVDDYSTGTIAVTNGSTAVTGTTTVWTAAMVGRKIRVSGEKPYYRIVSINTGAQTLVLDHEYQGDDDATASYEIFKDEYRLNADVDKYKTIRQIENGIPLFSITPSDFDKSYPTPEAYSNPMFEIMVGTEIEVYITGTLAGATNTLTGNNTEWASVEGLGKGSKIRVGNYWYTVKSVDSDTSITTYETLPTIAAGSAYEIKLDNIVVQLYQIPNSAKTLYYRYFRKPAPLANDYDSPDMPSDYHHLLSWGALSELLSQKGDINKAYTVYEDRFVAGLQQMKFKIGSFAPDRIITRKSCDGLKRGMTRGLENSSFDRRHSM